MMHPVTCDVTLPVNTERAYYAWTSGWALWFADAASLQVDVRAGAPFCFDVVVPAAAGGLAARHAHYGRFLELVPHERLRCTWLSGPHGTGGAETTITLHFSARRDGGTDCTLVHEGFATEEARERHAASWPLVLAHQGRRLAAIADDEWQRLLDDARVPLRNRSAPSAAFIPTRSYPDLDAAVLWLVEVLGCTERLRVPGQRVQLTLGDGAVVVAAWDPATAPASGGRPPATLVVRVANVDDAWTRALAHGATGLAAPATQIDGERQATVRDPAGHVWALTQTVADIDPVSWGGILRP
jgi:uncharacterized glyoxalase superfamily protein PhnB/uncharacterized protein YndB with AHSA1/START domain